MDLTDRQAEALDFIVQTINERGCPPTINEIMNALNLQYPRAVVGHLEALEKKRYIKRNPGARGIQILKTANVGLDSGVVRLPLVGTTAAGLGVLAEENIEEWVPVPSSMVGRIKNAFMLKVKGDSMIDAHILDGDMVIIEPADSAENGEIVLAIIDGEATIKYFYRFGIRNILRAANDKYPDMEPEFFRIQGKVKGVYRSLNS
jgi:repressor LexA